MVLLFCFKVMLLFLIWDWLITLFPITEVFLPCFIFLVYLYLKVKTFIAFSSTWNLLIVVGSCFLINFLGWVEWFWATSKDDWRAVSKFLLNSLFVMVSNSSVSIGWQIYFNCIESLSSRSILFSLSSSSFCILIWWCLEIVLKLFSSLLKWRPSYFPLL